MKLVFSAAGAAGGVGAKVAVPARALTFALGLVLTLTGCAASNDFPVFDRDQAEVDKLPADFDVVDLTDFDKATSRFSGEADGVRYYLIRREGEDPIGGACLAVAAGSNSAISCGGHYGVTTSSEVEPAYEAQLVPAPAVDGDGWRAISENVRVSD